MFTRLGVIAKESGQDWMPSMLRTHPMSDKRVRAIETHLPEVRSRSTLPSSRLPCFESDNSTLSAISKLCEHTDIESRDCSK